MIDGAFGSKFVDTLYHSLVQFARLLAQLAALRFVSVVRTSTVNVVKANQQNLCKTEKIVLFGEGASLSCVQKSHFRLRCVILHDNTAGNCATVSL